VNDYVADLETEVERLRQENERLKSFIKGDDIVFAWALHSKLTPVRLALLKALYRRDYLDRRTALNLFPDWTDAGANLRVHINKMRATLCKHGVFIETAHKRGYRLTPHGRENLSKLIIPRASHTE